MSTDQRTPRLHILFEFGEGASGGGNHFLQALRGELARRGLLAADRRAADVLLVNSHHCLLKAAWARWRSPAAVIIHRIDGPCFYGKAANAPYDALIFRFNRAYATGTVFQSAWSRQDCLDHGLAQPIADVTIINAPDPQVFARGPVRPVGKRLRLIYTSFSHNYSRKGFDFLEYLDKHLDFARYEMSFIGQSKVSFNHIRCLTPLPPAELAEELRQHDLCVFTARTEPCSNALLEALHCGLPAVALRQGGNPSIVGDAGVYFTGTGDLLPAIDEAASRLEELRSKIACPSLAEVVDRYVQFATDVWQQAQVGPRRRLSWCAQARFWRLAVSMWARRLIRA